MFDPVPLKMLDNVNTGTSQEFALNAFDRVELAVDFKTGVNAGVVILESAPFAGYTGTWFEEVAVTFSGTAPCVIKGQKDISARIGRLRVKTPLVGGNCDAYVSRQIIGKGNS